MPGVFVVTDSSCDLEQDDIAPFNIEIVPLTIRFGNEEFTDRLDLSTEDFYRRMSNSRRTCPRQPARRPARSNRHFAMQATLALRQWCVSTSRATCRQHFSRLAQRPQRATIPVHVIDSRTVSSGLGTLVVEAAKTAGGGADVAAVLQRVSDLIPRTHVLAALNTLENLKKGGRIGGATAMVGSMLSIKPVIDLTGGVVHEAGKARTRKRALQMLYERLSTAGQIEDVAVMHGGAPISISSSI